MLMLDTLSLLYSNSSVLFISSALRFIFPKKMKRYLFIYLLFITTDSIVAHNLCVFRKRRVMVYRSLEENAAYLLGGRR